MPARYAEAKSVRLTDAGRAFLEEARAIVKHADEAIKIARAVASAEPNELHVGYSPTPTAEIVPKILRAFQRAMPNVQVRLYDWSDKDILDGVRDGRLRLGLTREDYPNNYDYLSIIFSRVKQKPRMVEEHDSFSGIISAVEAGTGIAICSDVFCRSFGNRVKLLHITPEPKPISVGIARAKGGLGAPAGKFWQCAKEAASRK